jgi:hypothetical protein
MEILKYIFVIFLASPFIGFIIFGSLINVLNFFLGDKVDNFMERIDPLKNSSNKTKIISLYILFTFMGLIFFFKAQSNWYS